MGNSLSYLNNLLQFYITDSVILPYASLLHSKIYIIIIIIIIIITKNRHEKDEDSYA